MLTRERWNLCRVNASNLRMVPKGQVLVNLASLYYHVLCDHIRRRASYDLSVQSAVTPSFTQCVIIIFGLSRLEMSHKQ